MHLQIKVYTRTRKGTLKKIFFKQVRLRPIVAMLFIIIIFFANMKTSVQKERKDYQVTFI